MKIKKTAVSKLNKKARGEGPELTTQWTIRGIGIEARNAAQKAAHKNHEFIGSWVSRKLLAAAYEDIKGCKDVIKAEEGPDSLKTMQLEIVEEISKLTRKIEEITSKKSFMAKLFSK